MQGWYPSTDRDLPQPPQINNKDLPLSCFVVLRSLFRGTEQMSALLGEGRRPVYACMASSGKRRMYACVSIPNTRKRRLTHVCSERSSPLDATNNWLAPGEWMLGTW